MPLHTCTITLRHIIDDGAIFYVNGVEFHRFNMPAGPVDFMTQANTNVGDAVYSGPFSVTVTNVVPGENVIAVEVHQNGTASADVTFGAEFALRLPPWLPLPINILSLHIYRTAGEIRLFWPGTGFTLEQSDLLRTNGNWSPVPNQTNPYRIAPDNSGQRFYRLRK